jgi:hypothetical protein
MTGRVKMISNLDSQGERDESRLCCRKPKHLCDAEQHHRICNQVQQNVDHEDWQGVSHHDRLIRNMSQYAMDTRPADHPSE